MINKNRKKLHAKESKPNKASLIPIIDTIGSLDDLIENYFKREEIIIKILKNSLKFYTSKTTIDYYNFEIIKSGIKKFDNNKIYIDTSTIEGVNKIFKRLNITFENHPSRANMQPIENSVYFAKMKDSNKIVLLTNKDKDVINNMIFSTGFMGIKSNNKAPLSLLFSIIISNEFKKQRDSNSVGTTMASINNESFSKIIVPKLTSKEIIEFNKKFNFFLNELSLLRRKINVLKEQKQTLLNKYF